MNHGSFLFSALDVVIESASSKSKSKRRNNNRLELLVDDLLDLVVHHQHQRAAGAAEHVGQRALEEGLGALGLHDLGPAVDGRGVDAVGRARLHHQAAADGVEGVGGDTWRRRRLDGREVRRREKEREQGYFRSKRANERQEKATSVRCRSTRRREEGFFSPLPLRSKERREKEKKTHRRRP